MWFRKCANNNCLTEKVVVRRHLPPPRHTMAHAARMCLTPARVTLIRRAGESLGRDQQCGVRHRARRGCGAERGARRWVVRGVRLEDSPESESTIDDASVASKEALARDDDASMRAQKARLWETWWFEARNADALSVLAKLPDADINATTKQKIDPKAKQMWQPGGYTAVTLAAQRDDGSSIKRLHELGADLDCRDTNGASPVHHAAFENSVNAMRALLERGADGNAQDERDGSTPAILAAYGMRKQVLAVLLDWNDSVAPKTGPPGIEPRVLDLGLRDSGNATVAGHCAQRKLTSELVRILIQTGPGGAGRLLRGEKVYLAKKKELTGQLEVLSEAELFSVAKAWRARPSEGDAKKELILKLTQVTP